MFKTVEGEDNFDKKIIKLNVQRSHMAKDHFQIGQVQKVINETVSVKDACSLESVLE